MDVGPAENDTLTLSAIETIFRTSWSRLQHVSKRSKQAIPLAGFSDIDKSKPAILLTGSAAGRKSQCEPLSETISQKIDTGLSAQRITTASVAAASSGTPAVTTVPTRLNEQTPSNPQVTERSNSAYPEKPVEGEGTTMVYRGVSNAHPGYEDALNGRAAPRGGSGSATKCCYKRCYK